MIIQSVERGSPHFVIRQVDHARMCGQMARAFGNDRFAPLEPRELMEFVAENHDEGWRPFDDNPQRDPKTNLPYAFTNMPIEDRVSIGQASPDFNEQHHPYCGLLSSMHYWGVYHDRYGINKTSAIDQMPAEAQTPLRAMLDLELVRQERLKAALAKDPATAPWVEEARLMHNYKLLQFFDLLALYFNTRHEGDRPDTVFDFVPAAVGRAEPVRVQAVEPGIYRLTPFPFQEDRLLVDCDGRYVAHVPPDADVQAAVYAAPVVQQTFALEAG
jgi:Protein of unknown function (DUF3891)